MTHPKYPLHDPAHCVDCQTEAIAAAENIFANLQAGFHHHPSQPTPPELRVLMRCQFWTNVNRYPASIASMLRDLNRKDTSMPALIEKIDAIRAQIECPACGEEAAIDPELKLCAKCVAAQWEKDGPADDERSDECTRTFLTHGSRVETKCGSTNGVVKCAECSTALCLACQNTFPMFNVNGKPVCEDCVTYTPSLQDKDWPFWEA